jgi:hypothetical protein
MVAVKECKSNCSMSEKGVIKIVAESEISQLIMTSKEAK